MSNQTKKDSAIYRGISIQFISDGRYYTLGAFYHSLDAAKSKIDRYWDYNENSDSIV